MKKIIIIGGVAAGMSAAAKAKRLNPELEIVVYEKTDIVSWGACGLPYYVGDFYQDANIMIAREPEQFAKDGIVVKSLHEVIDIDITKKEVLVLNKKTGEKFYDSYDEVIVTTGASAIRPNIKNIDSENIFNLKDFRDGIELKKAMLKEENRKVIIIGAGYIGLEAGEAARHLNKEVKIIQLSSRVLPGSFDKEITDLMEEELNNTENLDLHLEESVEEFVNMVKRLDYDVDVKIGRCVFDAKSLMSVLMIAGNPDAVVEAHTNDIEAFKKKFKDYLQ